MKNLIIKILYFFIIISLYLSTPVCIFAVINIGVSIKYEVDETSYFIKANNNLNKAEKKIRNEEIEKLSVKLHTEQYLWALASISLPILASILLAKRNKIIY